LFDEGDPVGARAIGHKLAQWTIAAFIESNPIPLKAALSYMGRMSNVLRLPLVPLAESHSSKVRAAIRAAGAID
jgi:4-hydroxy-tetrahydrodipicolinate synthase